MAVEGLHMGKHGSPDAHRDFHVCVMCICTYTSVCRALVNATGACFMANNCKQSI